MSSLAPSRRPDGRHVPLQRLSQVHGWSMGSTTTSILIADLSNSSFPSTLVMVSLRGLRRQAGYTVVSNNNKVKHPKSEPFLQIRMWHGCRYVVHRVFLCQID